MKLLLNSNNEAGIAGKEAKLCYTESVLMENRNGIVIDLRVGQATGRPSASTDLRCSKSWAERDGSRTRATGPMTPVDSWQAATRIT